MARIKPQALLQQSKTKKRPSQMSFATIAVYGLVIFVMVFFLFTTYRHWTQRSKLQLESGIEVITTAKGSITVELYKEDSPEVVDKFIESCKKGRFKGMLFNRVIKNFVIQGGEANRPGAVEDWTSRGKNYNQFDTSLKHEAFMLGTSKVKQGDEGFDLLITTAPIPDLNEKINVFGRVVKGEDVVQEIEEADTDEHYKPKTLIGILEVTLKQQI